MTNILFDDDLFNTIRTIAMSADPTYEQKIIESDRRRERIEESVKDDLADPEYFKNNLVDAIDLVINNGELFKRFKARDWEGFGEMISNELETYARDCRT